MTPRAPGAEGGGAVLSERERHLARSALGLQYDDRRQSYRNRFAVYDQTSDFDVWRGLMRRDLARGQINAWPKLSWFRLTRTGAEAALYPGESLCPEDFPPAGSAAPAGERSDG